MGPSRGRGALRKGCRAPPSTRESPCWWSPATTAPARHVKRRARTWQRHRTKKSRGTLTLQQVNRCPVVLSVLMNNWRWILKSHLLHSYLPPSAISQQPHSLCSGSERRHCRVHISCVSRPQIEVLTADPPWYFWHGFAPSWWGQISGPLICPFFNSRAKAIESPEWRTNWERRGGGALTLIWIKLLPLFQSAFFTGVGHCGEQMRQQRRPGRGFAAAPWRRRSPAADNTLPLAVKNVYPHRRRSSPQE